MTLAKRDIISYPEFVLPKLDFNMAKNGIKKLSSTKLNPGLQKFSHAFDATHYEAAYQIGKKLFIEFQNNLGFLQRYGRACYLTDRLDEAVAAYNQLLKSKPDEFNTLYELGRIMRLKGHDDQALLLFHATLQHNNEHLPSLCELQRLYAQYQKWDKVVSFAAIHLKIAPHQQIPWRFLYAAIAHCDVAAMIPDLANIIEVCLRGGNLHESYIIWVALDVLWRRSPAFYRYVQLAQMHSIKGLVDIDTEALVENASNKLLFTLLNYAIVPHDGFEVLVSAYRFTFVFKAINKNESPSLAQFELACSLANYFFTTEYLPDMDQAEFQYQKQLREECEHLLASAKTLTMEQAYRFVLLAQYQSLDTLNSSERLTSLADKLNIKSFSWLTQELCEVLLKEKALAATVASFSATSDAVSLLVKEQYEENPYPRWRNTRTEENVAKNPAALVHELLPYSKKMDFPIPEHTDILIAGCGTGRQSIHVVMNYTDIRVCNIDLSKRSIAYAMMKAKELGYDRKMEFIQGDILDLEHLGRSFHFIECCGVLHHMKNPLAGWKKLYDSLKPGGLMRIALYSKNARQSIIALREQIAAENYPDTIEGMRAFRKIAKKNENFIFRTSTDFFTTSACRDLLFHRQEHQFTLPMIKEALDILGLKFIGIEYITEAHMDYLKRFPEDEQEQKLEHWEIMERENPNMFAGMYSFWCYKPKR